MATKIALITGANKGIGFETARQLGAQGMTVLAAARDEERGRAAERALRDGGADAQFVRLDVTDAKSPQRAAEWIEAEYGRLDVLVNNAAYQMTHQSVDEFSSEEWDRTFRTNIYAMFYLAKAALPRMKPGSVIVNTASVQAYKPNGMLLAYATTKGAIVTFTKALSELAVDKGIRVNAVAPGPVWTPLIPSTMPREKVEKFGQDDPFKRPAQPAELAPAYVFLATQDSSYVTGSVMDLTGGKMLP
jgi:NAD(P)-dependent dehydrogenase (short-subunit alcohol dehydrogenase family)